MAVARDRAAARLLRIGKGHAVLVVGPRPVVIAEVEIVIPHAP
jgi:hypothetical protein